MNLANHMKTKAVIERSRYSRGKISKTWKGIVNCFEVLSLKEINGTISENIFPTQRADAMRGIG